MTVSIYRQAVHEHHCDLPNINWHDEGDIEYCGVCHTFYKKAFGVIDRFHWKQVRWYHFISQHRIQKYNRAEDKNEN